MRSNREKGSYGERLAEARLVGSGYRIISRNFRVRSGEIDLIAEKDGTVVFAEVKYRKNLDAGYPAESVTAIKQHRIRRTAEYYIMKNSLDGDFRFDVIQIIGGDPPVVDHIENAF